MRRNRFSWTFQCTRAISPSLENRLCLLPFPQFIYNIQNPVLKMSPKLGATMIYCLCDHRASILPPWSSVKWGQNSWFTELFWGLKELTDEEELSNMSNPESWQILGRVNRRAVKQGSWKFLCRRPFYSHPCLSVIIIFWDKDFQLQFMVMEVILSLSLSLLFWKGLFSAMEKNGSKPGVFPSQFCGIWGWERRLLRTEFKRKPCVWWKR